MPSKYIPVFPNVPNPPNSSRQPQHDGSDDIQSDFPPYRVHESTPDPITPPTNLRKSYRPRRKQCSSPSESEAPRRLPRLLTTGLGVKNILNTIQVTVAQPSVRFPFLVVGDTKEVFARMFRS